MVIRPDDEGLYIKTDDKILGGWTRGLEPDSKAYVANHQWPRTAHMGLFEVKSQFRGSCAVLRPLFRIQGLSPFP
jgi:hypothetical protein